MNGWGEFIAAFAVFFASHAIPVRPRVKGPLVAMIGARGFSLSYSALSVAVLAWLILAAGRAPVIELWPMSAGARLANLALMALAAGLFALAIGRPNPLSFGGAGNARFDPAAPGLIGWTRHPLLWVLFLWSVAHVIANGDLAHALMFGAFALFSLAGMRLIDRRKRRQLGAGEWARLAATRRGIAITGEGALRLACGAGLYALLLWLHGPVLGAWPLG